MMQGYRRPNSAELAEMNDNLDRAARDFDQRNRARGVRLGDDEDIASIMAEYRAKRRQDTEDEYARRQCNIMAPTNARLPVYCPK